MTTPMGGSASEGARAFLDSHGVEQAVRSAIAHVLKERPEDPVAAIGRFLTLCRKPACGLDELYYGSVPAHLVPVPGAVVRFVRDEWCVNMSAVALESTLARSGHIAAGGEADVVVPCIPSRELSCPVPCTNVSAWPAALRAPLLKAATRTPNEPKAVASGARSCLVKLDGSWYRLKGCGNHDRGFEIRSNRSANGKPPYHDIRGCAFGPTAIRENYMTATLATALEPKGILGTNVAMGYFLYDPPHCPLGAAAEVRPACIVEKTRGDRRLGSHVLSGLELLLPLLVEADALSLAAVRELFPAGRPGRAALGTEHFLTTATLSYCHLLMTNPPVPEIARELLPPECASLLVGDRIVFDADKLAHLNQPAVSLPERAPPTGSAHAYPEQWTNEGARPMSERWKPLWDATVLDLANGLASIAQRRAQASDGQPAGAAAATSCTCVLGYLYSRLGRDCGRILRAMHDERVSWGTYQDAMCRVHLDEWHCNAHSNNVVLLDEAVGSQHGSFLSYLDLDMAFDGASFVDTRSWTDTFGHGAQPEEHDALLAKEAANFMEVLCGGDASNGVPQVARSEVDKRTSPELAGVKSALYDTLLLSFSRVYVDRDDSAAAQQVRAQGRQRDVPLLSTRRCIHRSLRSLLPFVPCDKAPNHSSPAPRSVGRWMRSCTRRRTRCAS